MTPNSVPGPLAAACDQVRPADDADTVAGVRPRYVAAPDGTDQAAAVLRAAAGLDLAVVPRGAGTRLDWAAPPRRCDLLVDTTRMAGVLEHAAGDLVARVQAGVRLERLAEVLGTLGQRLALDPPDAAGPGGAGTVGGLVATGVAGPLRLRYGAPRDLLIGITVVRADGTIARSGGKVVKNVAGYDLGKLFAGSYGTLGLITEAAFRLHPSPAAVAYVTRDCPDAVAAQALLAAAADSPLAPAAAELDWPGRGAPISTGVLLEGDRDGVAERAERMRALLDGAEVSAAPPPWWGRGAAAAGGTVLRVAFWAGDLALLLTTIADAAAAAGLDPAAGGSAAAGVLHVALPPDAVPAAVAEFVTALRTALSRRPALAGARSSAGATVAGQSGSGNSDFGISDIRQSDPGQHGSGEFGLGKHGSGQHDPGQHDPGQHGPGGPAAGPPGLGSAVVLHAPAAVRDVLDMWGPVPALALMRAVKDQFDPEHRLAPGRFAGGI